MTDRQALHWDGLRLHYRRRVVATLVADEDWPKLYRVHLPDGRITDMVNLTRAKDAAVTLARSVLDGQQAA